MVPSIRLEGMKASATHLNLVKLLGEGSETELLFVFSGNCRLEAILAQRKVIPIRPA